MSLRLPRFSGPSVRRAPRPPSGAPPPPPIRRTEGVTQESLYGDRVPAGWQRAETEGIVWKDLVSRGWKIYGRPNVQGQTLNYAEADAIYQPAIPVAGLNQTKDFFRADFLIVPGKKGPSPGPPYSRGIILDPVTDWTHRNTGVDRLRRGLLAQAGYLLVWIDAGRTGPLYTRPHQIITIALYGGDDSSIDRGTR